MNHLKKTVIIFLSLFFILGSSASAQDVGTSLAEINFGDVEFGDSISTTIRITSTGLTPLMITAFTLTGEEDGAEALPDFLIEDYIYNLPYGDGYTTELTFPELPPEMMPDEYIDVVLSFTPELLGLRESFFTIVSNDRETPVMNIPIYGVGVKSAVPLPATIFFAATGFLYLAGYRKIFKKY